MLYGVNLVSILDAKTRLNEDPFDDLLASSGFKIPDQKAKKLSELKKEALSSNLDPQKAKVRDNKIIGYHLRTVIYYMLSDKP